MGNCPPNRSLCRLTSQRQLLAQLAAGRAVCAPCRAGAGHRGGAESSCAPCAESRARSRIPEEVPDAEYLYL